MVIAKFNIRERGPTPRNFRKAFNASSKESWYETGVHYHQEFRDKRFTQAHATMAGYQERKKGYTRQKFRKVGHTRPLEFSGKTRQAVRSASISSTSKGNRVKYPGARTFNFRHPKSNINMRAEFTRVLPREADQLAEFYDRQLDHRLNAFDEA